MLNDYTERLYPNLEELRKEKEIENEKKENQQKLSEQKEEIEDGKREEKEQNQDAEIEQKDDAQIEGEGEQNQDSKPSKSMNELIKDELEQLKKDQIFYVFELKLQSLIFIRISDPYKDIIDVQKLGGAIIHDIFEEKKTLTRFCLRFLPILFVWKASNFDNFKTLSANEIKEYFNKLDGVKWSMEWKARGNKAVKQNEVLNVSLFFLNL